MDARSINLWAQPAAAVLAALSRVCMYLTDDPSFDVNCGLPATVAKCFRYGKSASTMYVGS